MTISAITLIVLTLALNWLGYYSCPLSVLHALLTCSFKDCTRLNMFPRTTDPLETSLNVRWISTNRNLAAIHIMIQDYIIVKLSFNIWFRLNGLHLCKASDAVIMCWQMPLKGIGYRKVILGRKIHRLLQGRKKTVCDHMLPICLHLYLLCNCCFSSVLHYLYFF